MSKTFDINKQPTEIWATYVPSRKPQFKVYNREHLAKSSLVNSGSWFRRELYEEMSKEYNRLYKLQDGKWIEQDDY